MRQAFFDRPFAPGEILLARLAAAGAPVALGKVEQALRRGALALRLAVEHHVLAGLAQLGVDRLVDGELAGIDDAHVHAGLDGVVEEHRVHGLADRLVAAEREGQVRHAARDVDAGHPGRDLARGLDEGKAVTVMLLDAGGDGEDVGVEDDVLRLEPGLFGQELEGATGNLDLALPGVGLAVLVEGHDDDGRTIGAAEPRLLQERFLALLHGDGVDDRLALHAFQPGLDDLPFGGIDHHRYARDVGFGGDEVEELDHRLLRIDQALVHVDVDDLGSVLDLVAGDVEGGGEIAGRDQLAEPGRAGDVGTLADIDEGDVGGEREGFEARKPHQRLDRGDLARLVFCDGGGNGRNVLRRRAAAAADDVDQPLAGEAFDLRRHRLGTLVIFAHLVGQAGIGVGADQSVGNGRQLGQMRAHRIGAERAVQPDRQRPGVADGVPEGGRGLAGQGAARQVGDGAGNHDRQLDAFFLEYLEAGEDRRLGVERVEDGLDQDQVGAAVDQAAQLLAIGDAEVIEGDGAIARIVDVGRDRRGAVGRSERAGDETRPAIRLLGAERGAAGETGAVAVEVVDHLLHAVVCLRDARGGEGVGLEDIGPGHRVAVMDFLDRRRLREDQEVVVALLVAGAAAEALAAEMVLAIAQRLDFRAHRAVEHQNALGGRRLQRRDAIGSRSCLPFGSEQGVDGGGHGNTRSGKNRRRTIT